MDLECMFWYKNVIQMHQLIFLVYFTQHKLLNTYTPKSLFYISSEHYDDNVSLVCCFGAHLV